jgi:nucleoside-diphosphate kinase
MVNELSRGPAVAVEVTGPEAVAKMRALAGPRDIEVAKRVRATTLRAKYGVSAACSSVHVTDLAEDGSLECEYIFAILDQ